MRIAISGSHGTGKSTLVSALSAELQHYEVIPEPYHELLEEGHSFDYPPSLDDFRAQLEYSLRRIDIVQSRDALFDRCPADYVAYLTSYGAVGRESVAEFFDSVTRALSGLDLVVFVPIERPDRIALVESEFPKLRRNTDSYLRSILIDDEWGLDLNVVEVAGSVPQRVSQVLTRANAARQVGEGRIFGQHVRGPLR